MHRQKDEKGEKRMKELGKTEKKIWNSLFVGNHVIINIIV